MAKLVVELPTKDTPGFLKRSKSALVFKARLQAKVIDPNIFDDMIEFILPIVKEPIDRDEARAALWDASQEQFDTVMDSLVGTVNPTKAENSTPLPDTTSQA